MAHTTHTHTHTHTHTCMCTSHTHTLTHTHTHTHIHTHTHTHTQTHTHTHTQSTTPYCENKMHCAMLYSNGWKGFDLWILYNCYLYYCNSKRQLRSVIFTLFLLHWCCPVLSSLIAKQLFDLHKRWICHAFSNRVNIFNHWILLSLVFCLDFVHPLQDVALHQCLPLSSVCCFPGPGGSLLLCYVIVPSSAWSSSWSLPSPCLSFRYSIDKTFGCALCIFFVNNRVPELVTYSSLSFLPGIPLFVFVCFVVFHFLWKKERR